MSAHLLSVLDDQLIELLLEAGVLTETKAEVVRAQALENESSLYQTLIQTGVISDENLGKLIADFHQLPFVSFQSRQIKPEDLQLLSEQAAQNHQVVAFGQNDSEVLIASCLPDQSELCKQISEALQKSVKLHFTTPAQLQDALQQYKPLLVDSLKELLLRSSEANLPISQVVHTIILNAHRQNASDIHLEPTHEYCVVRFRIDGMLQDVVKLPKNIHTQLVNRVKVLARLRTDEHFSAQDGRAHIQDADVSLDLRVSVVPYVKGEKVVLRLLSSNVRQYTLETLGLSQANILKIQHAIQKPYGMVLSTGPTGSGKTTTMYALLKKLNSRDKNIATIEDPVEYQMDGVNQVQVNSKTNLSFSQGLRSLLRQDPDIMYVGEIRDRETAQIAVNAATTGHLVLSTLHTNDAATTFPRLYDMQIEPFLIATTVHLIIGQRLVRTICENCKVTHHQNPEDVSDFFPKKLLREYFGNHEVIEVYQAKGCPACHHTGYRGRIGLFEVLEVSESIRRLIIQRADSTEIVQAAVSDGMRSMLEDAVDKVQRGITTFQEVMRAVKV